MSAGRVVRFGQHIKELRIHLCQKSATSKGVSNKSIQELDRTQARLMKAALGIRKFCRTTQCLEALKIQKISTLINVYSHILEKKLYRDFIEQHYVNIKKENPRFPILIRECSGIQPKMWARYEHGKESHIELNNLNSQQVLQAMENLVQKPV